MSTMRLAEIWRYPVKSMAGERLDAVELSPHGIPGDRVIQVYDARGRRLTARTHPGLLGFRAVLSSDGEPAVDGQPWTAAEVAAAVERAVGRPVRLGNDVLPLLVVTDGIVAHLGVDRRRFRPNLFIEGVTGLAERDWEGAAACGSAGDHRLREPAWPLRDDDVRSGHAGPGSQRAAPDRPRRLYNRGVDTARSVEQEWVAKWREAGPALAEQRAQELREMTEAQALAAAEALLSLALVFPLSTSRLTDSGLVRQQAFFHRRLPP